MPSLQPFKWHDVEPYPLSGDGPERELGSSRRSSAVASERSSVDPLSSPLEQAARTLPVLAFGIEHV